MKKEYKYILFIWCCVCYINSNAQNQQVKDLFSKITQVYIAKKQYEIDVTYAMYRGAKGNNITESYTGKMVKNNEFSQFKVLDSEMLQFSNTQLSINHKTKTITYIPVKGASAQDMLFNMNTFLQYYDKATITEKNGIIICDMVPTKHNDQNQYGKVTLYINKDSYLIEKQELFFSNLIPFVEDKNTTKMDIGRLVIVLKYNQLASKTAPTLNEYIQVLSTKKVTLVEQYKGYHLINQAH